MPQPVLLFIISITINVVDLLHLVRSVFEDVLFFAVISCHQALILCLGGLCFVFHGYLSIFSLSNKVAGLCHCVF